jgi:tetratricopeptide (TPR) repeat protein
MPIVGAGQVVPGEEVPMNAQASALRQAGYNALRAGRLDEAIRDFQQAAALEPEAYDTFAYLGAAYARQGDYEKARRAFGRAVQIRPDSPKARYNLGSAHQMAGDTEAARICYQAALDLDPNYTQAREALAKLPKKEISVSELASPGAMHLPGAQATRLEDEEAVADAPALTPEEVAKLAAPGGHLHIMGAQAMDEDQA